MGRLEKKSTISVGSISCPACDAEGRSISYVFYDNGQEYPVFNCACCTFKFIRPLPLQELNDRQMDSLEDAELLGSPLMKFLHQAMYLDKEIRIIKNMVGDNASLMDVGCGTGWISNVWAQNGFEVTGLEPSTARRDHAREKYGLNVVSGYIEDTEFDKCFDIAVLRHVIEHFQDPGEVLKKIHETLKLDGIVMVVVPNIDCIGRYLFGVNWEWVLPWHCNFFNKRSLESLLENSGFEIIKTYQTASPFYYFESLVRKCDSKILKSINERFKVPSMLASSPIALLGLALGLGDNLTIMARVQK